MANVDITPATNLGGSQPNGIHFHSAGNSAAAYNNPSDFPYVDPQAAGPSAVAVKVAGVRFSNPS